MVEGRVPHTPPKRLSPAAVVYLHTRLFLEGRMGQKWQIRHLKRQSLRKPPLGRKRPEKRLLRRLKELELILQERMQFAEEKSLASLARQYRETLKEIEEIEGSQGEEDELSRILAE